MAKHLGVSPPTMGAALSLLLAEGWISKPGERQAYRVAKAGHRKVGPKRKLLILTPELPSLTIETSRKILDAIRHRMLDKGWQVEVQILDYRHAKKARGSWDRVIAADENTWIIALYGRPSLAEWAIRRKLQMIFLGGTTDGFPVPIVGVKSSNLLEIVLLKLTALGHRKIVIPLCDRAESFHEAMRAVTRKVLEAAGHSYVAAYHNPESSYNDPGVMARIIESAFVSNPPTALVFMDWNELLAAYCVLSKLRLRVPEDVSLVLLNDQSDARWFLPQLTRFRFPEKRLTQALASWLEGRLTIGTSEPLVFPADFLAGETLVAPKPT